jgi:hypothetical protein
LPFALPVVFAVFPSGFVEVGAGLFVDCLRASLRRIAVGQLAHLQGGGSGQRREAIAALPLSARGLGILRGADVATVAYLASGDQTLPLHNEILRGPDPEVPVGAALRTSWLLLAG